MATVRMVAHHRSAPVPPGSLRTVGECPWCGCGDRERLLRVQSDPDVWFARCTGCRLVSATEYPDDDFLNRYYDGYYERSEPATRGGRCVTVAAVARASRRIANSLRQGEPAAGAAGELRLFDFGGGDGSLAAGVATVALAERRCRSAVVTVVDPNYRVRTATDPRIAWESAPSVAQWRETDGGTLADVTLASAVLEHLPQPRHALEELLLATRPGGLVYVRTPWAVPLALVLHRLGVEVDLTYPGHLHDMGGDFWDRAADLLRGVQAEVVVSRTSFVESSLRSSVVRTVAGAGLKVPTRLLGSRWPYCGGWEVVLRRC